MAVNTKFIDFMKHIKSCDELLMESIMCGYNLIYESSENIVHSIEERLGKNNTKNPLDSDLEPENIEPDTDELHTEQQIEEPTEDEQLI